MKRRLFLSAAALGATCFGWVRFGEPKWFQVTRTQIRGKRLPKLRILHVSDLHVSDGMTAEELEVGWRAGLATKPDLICLTGDYVSSNIGFDKAGLARMLRQAAETAPTFAVLGNHDGGSWLARQRGDASTKIVGDIVRHAGVRLLVNESSVSQGVRLVGSADMWSGNFHPQKAFSFGKANNSHSLKPLAGEEPTILLCHNPDAKEAFAPWHWDLMLSGHTHGGQGRIPLVKPFWVPVQDKRYVAGLYTFRDRPTKYLSEKERTGANLPQGHLPQGHLLQGNLPLKKILAPVGPIAVGPITDLQRIDGQAKERQLFITRGIGSPRHVRAFCRPELSVLELSPA